MTGFMTGVAVMIIFGQVGDFILSSTKFYQM
jgi:MFS superfamily sulfate permease-like transporter